MNSQTVERREKDKVSTLVRLFFMSDQQMIGSKAINVSLASKVEIQILILDLLTGNYRENGRWLQLSFWCTHFTLKFTRNRERCRVLSNGVNEESAKQ